MKLLIYAHSFAPRIGGAEGYVELVSSYLSQSGEGVAVTVVTRAPADGIDDRAFPFQVVRRPGLQALWRLIGEADVVHLAGPCLAPLGLALLRRRPVVTRHHGYQACCPNGLLFYEPTKSRCPNHFMARRYWQCLRCNAAVVGWARSLRMLCLSFPRRWLSKHASVNIHNTHSTMHRICLPKSTVVYHGTPDPLGDPTLGPAHEPSAPPSKACCFAYVGRLVSEKGLPLLVEAAALLRNQGHTLQLKFIGDGPERARLTGLAAERGIETSVVFTGFLTGAALRDAIADVTAVVMPSVWEETAGLSAIEQMMRGQLVIASDIAGLGELVDGVGLKFPPGDVEALATCMRRVLEEPDLAAQLGHAARERALELFSTDRMVSEHLRVFRQAASQRE